MASGMTTQEAFQWKEALREWNEQADKSKWRLVRPQWTFLPAEIGKLHSLEKLMIQQCIRLTSLPEELGHLRNLRVLILRRCALESLPSSIGQLQSLEVLRVEECPAIQRLPDSMGQLQNLEKLQVASCSNLLGLPEEIGRLTNLRHLILSDNKLGSWPSSIAKLPSLEIFTLDKLACLPDWLGELTTLKVLQVHYCRCSTSLPDSVGNLRSLQILSFRTFSDSTPLPESIGNLTQLQELEIVMGTDLQHLPDSIMGLQNLKVFTLKIKPALPLELCQLTNLKRLELIDCGIRDWTDLIAIPLPPRLRVLKCANLRYSHTDRNFILQFLAKNPYVKSFRREVSCADDMLTLNHFRPILEGGHIASVDSYAFIVLLTSIQKRLKQRNRTAMTPSVIFALLRSQPVSSWAGSQYDDSEF